jgi:hypothetical protein
MGALAADKRPQLAVLCQSSFVRERLLSRSLTILHSERFASA